MAPTPTPAARPLLAVYSVEPYAPDGGFRPAGALTLLGALAGARLQKS